MDRRDYATGELWKNELPFRLALNRAASDDNALHCKVYAGHGEKSFYKSGAALAEGMGMPVSKMGESIEARIQASLKTAHDLSVDLSDCANDVQMNSLQYCSDQNEIHATVLKSFICVDVPLVRSSCSSVGAKTYTGSEDPPSAVPFCYIGSKLGERVNLKVNSFDSEAGSFDLTGSGLKSISCLRKSFSKSGQDLEADSDVDSGTANRAHRH